MLYTTEIGRAQYHLRQAEALFARAADELPDTKDIKSSLDALSNAITGYEVDPGKFFVPDDGRTCLHQCSLALINVRGSLIAVNRIREANMANSIRGDIIDWFEAHSEE